MKMLRNCRPDTQVVRRLDYESRNPGFNPRPGQIFLWIIRMFSLGPSGNVSFKNIQFSFLIRGTETILLSFTKVIHHYHHISCRIILPGHKSPPSFPVTAALTMSSVRLVGGRPTLRCVCRSTEFIREIFSPNGDLVSGLYYYYDDPCSPMYLF